MTQEEIQKVKDACAKTARWVGLNHHCINNHEIEQIIRSVVADICGAIQETEIETEL